MQAWFLLAHPLPAVLCHDIPIQPVGPFCLGLDTLAVMPPELADQEAVFWDIRCLLTIQRTAGNTVGIGIMVLCDAMDVPEGFGVHARGGEYLAWELRVQFPQEIRHDLVQH